MTGDAVMSDDFTRYSSTTDLKQNISKNIGGLGDGPGVLYVDGYHGQMAELDRTVTYNGHPTMKYNQLASTDTGPALWAYLPDGKTIPHMWYRATIRFSPGYTTRGILTNSANAYKLLGWGFNDPTQFGTGRIEITNTDQYQLYWGAVSKQTQQASSSTNFGIGGNIVNEWNDGAWYDYVIEYAVISPTRARARMWMGKQGGPLTLRTESVADALPGYTIPNVRFVALGLNFNQIRGPNQNQAVWYGRWEVVDGSQYANPFGVPGA